MTSALAQDILQRSGEHLLLVALAVALALLIALPLRVALLPAFKPVGRRG